MEPLLRRKIAKDMGKMVGQATGLGIGCRSHAHHQTHLCRKKAAREAKAEALKQAKRQAKAETLKQAKRQARLDAEAAAAEGNNSAENDDKLMSLEDLALEDLTPAPLRQVPEGIDQKDQSFGHQPGLCHSRICQLGQIA